MPVWPYLIYKLQNSRAGTGVVSLLPSVVSKALVNSTIKLVTSIETSYHCQVYILQIWSNLNYLIDSGRTFDIESLSISLTTSSFLRKNNVPLDTLTGMRIRSARTVIGTKIFKLLDRREKFSYKNVSRYRISNLKASAKVMNQKKRWLRLFAWVYEPTENLKKLMQNASILFVMLFLCFLISLCTIIPTVWGCRKQFSWVNIAWMI